MLYIDVLTERADDNAPVPVKGLSQGSALVVFSHSIDAVAESHAHPTKPQMIGKGSRTMEVHRRDMIYVWIWAKFMNGGQILVYAGIICPSQFVSIKASLVVSTCSKLQPEITRRSRSSSQNVE